MNKKVDSIVLGVIVEQLLALIDNGKSIKQDEAIKWFLKQEIYQQLYSKFKNELYVFDSRASIGYKYDKVLKYVYDYGSEKDLDRFKNGLLGLVNMLMRVRNDEQINWTMATPEYKQ